MLSIHASLMQLLSVLLGSANYFSDSGSTKRLGRNTGKVRAKCAVAVIKLDTYPDTPSLFFMGTLA